MSQVAPKVVVKTKVNEAAAAPYVLALAGLFIAALDNPPDKNIEMPMTIAPQYKETRRPRRSSVKIAMSVENWNLSVPIERLGTHWDVPCK